MRQVSRYARNAFGGLCLAAAGLCLAQPGPARGTDAQPANESRIALVIGNASYRSSPLLNPTHDATDIGRRLEELGFKVILKLNADQREMKRAIREFSSGLRGRGGVGLFYFAGHGIQSKGRNYLLPVSADVQNEYELEDESVDANLVLAAMDDAQARVSIVILDACRNNPFAKSFRSVQGGLAQMEAAKGTLIGFATAPGSVAQDGTGRNGLYTKHLLESLKDPGADVERIFKRVTQGVARETQGTQVPWVSSSLTGDFYFAASAAKAAKAASPGEIMEITTVPGESILIQVELKFWDSIQSSKNPEEYQAYLDQYPYGRFVGIAKARLRAMGGSK